MTKFIQLHPLAKIVRHSARVTGIPELGLNNLKADKNTPAVLVYNLQLVSIIFCSQFYTPHTLLELK